MFNPFQPDRHELNNPYTGRGKRAMLQQQEAMYTPPAPAIDRNRDCIRPEPKPMTFSRQAPKTVRQEACESMVYYRCAKREYHDAAQEIATSFVMSGTLAPLTGSNPIKAGVEGAWESADARMRGMPDALSSCRKHAEDVCSGKKSIYKNK